MESDPLGIPLCRRHWGAERSYQIATAEQLISTGLDPNLASGHFLLVANIDLSGRTFSGAVIPEFSGTFDGNDLCIRNLKIHGEQLLAYSVNFLRGTGQQSGCWDVNIVGSNVMIGGLVGENLAV